MKLIYLIYLINYILDKLYIR